MTIYTISSKTGVLVGPAFVSRHDAEAWKFANADKYMALFVNKLVLKGEGE